MRMITAMLLASVLAIGAGSIAGCGETDCPATVSAQSSCSSEGLSCFAGPASCTCVQGRWACVDDLPLRLTPDLSMRDLAPPVD